MPELPEVETLARKLQPLVSGRRIARVEVLWERTVARPDVVAFGARLSGAQVTQVTRRAKYLVLALADGGTLLVHLRMSGKFTFAVVAPADYPPHTRLLFAFEDGAYLFYCDPRKFGRFYLVDDPQSVWGALGPEPLAPEFDAAILAARLAGRRGELKRVLLDQRVLAGLGNIYVNEALWRAGLHPQRRAASLTPPEVARLQTAIVAVLQEGVAHGGASLGDRQYVYPDGGLGEQQQHLAVYDRAAEPCPQCAAPIERIVQGQRSTYYCPHCQPPVPQEPTIK